MYSGATDRTLRAVQCAERYPTRTWIRRRAMFPYDTTDDVGDSPPTIPSSAIDNGLSSPTTMYDGYTECTEPRQPSAGEMP